MTTFADKIRAIYNAAAHNVTVVADVTSGVVVQLTTSISPVNWPAAMEAAAAGTVGRTDNNRFAEQLAALNGIPQGNLGTNSLAHAVTSALMTWNYGAEAAKFAGDMHEVQTERSDIANGLAWDKFKDMWNNQIGREIGQYALDNHLTANQTVELVLDAYSTGKLINDQSSSRIDSNFSGHTADFNNSAVDSYSGPSGAAAVYSIPSLPIFMTSATGHGSPLRQLIHCFAGDVLIDLANGGKKEISKIAVGDRVMAFDQYGNLRGATVSRLLRGVTTEWVELADGTRVTPSHRYCNPGGTFSPIKEILEFGRQAVDMSGKPQSISGRIIRSADGEVNADWVSTTEVDGSAVRRTSPVFGWPTYNFSVSDLHTYIAGGLRVHNECTQTGDSFNNFSFDPNSGTFTVTGTDEFGSALTITHIDNQFVSREVSFDTNGAVVKTTWNALDANGNPTGEPVREVSFPGAIITGEQIGTIFGSSIGQAIAGNNVFAQIAAGSALAAVVGNVAESLHIFFSGVRSLSNPASGPISFEQSVDGAFRDFGTDVFNQFQQQSLNAIGSFLTGELAEAAGFDGSSFGDQLLKATSGSLINTALQNVAAGANVFTNIAGNIPGAVSGFVGRPCRRSKAGKARLLQRAA